MKEPLPPLPAEPRPGHYRHFKGNEYRVLGFARHSETLEALVVYQPLYGERALWVRPAAMFVETVPHAGRHVPRFTYLGPAPAAEPPPFAGEASPPDSTGSRPSS